VRAAIEYSGSCLRLLTVKDTHFAKICLPMEVSMTHKTINGYLCRKHAFHAENENRNATGLLHNVHDALGTSVSLMKCGNN
jgi:hypothetical protein